MDTRAVVHGHHLIGLVVKASASRAGSKPACAGIFLGSSHTSDLKIGTPVATLPGIIGSALGLVGPVSVYCDWVRWKVGSATSTSVWQHIKLSEQIRPWDTLRLACCWNIKQSTNKQHCPRAKRKAEQGSKPQDPFASYFLLFHSPAPTLGFTILVRFLHKRPFSHPTNIHSFFRYWWDFCARDLQIFTFFLWVLVRFLCKRPTDICILSLGTGEMSVQETYRYLHSFFGHWWDFCARDLQIFTFFLWVLVRFLCKRPTDIYILSLGTGEIFVQETI